MKLLTLTDVSALIDSSPSKIKRLLREGAFPNPDYISSGPVWRPDQVTNWLFMERLRIDRRLKRVEDFVKFYNKLKIINPQDKGNSV